MDNLDLAKQKIKLIDIIPGSRKKTGKWTFINPCPICGHNDHFTITTHDNCYQSQSKCCKGGSIVDWFIESENLSRKDAVNKVLKISGLEREKVTHKELIKIQINKQLQEIITESKEVGYNNYFNKLVDIEKKLRKRVEELDKKTPFNVWLLGFLEKWTNIFIEYNPENYKKMFDGPFIDDFEMEYNNFIKNESLLNALYQIEHLI
ncbi:MAG: hypothetical protein PVJ67_05135 [Candidatus Pacearchaeota archaeon]|jgi:hypothetical protein